MLFNIQFQQYFAPQSLYVLRETTLSF